ncbi:hypothetical protein [Zoogloea sp.]|uniref:hypothetical protein n=1 Tax=Zoogloea sp. TaxID=49181 RepID=UPI0014160458|nr:MAG: hypothetical protein F9K15_12730 [Zoogloea sp.]
MPKNIAKILKQTSDKIYIKESTTGAEPSWVAADEIGYTDEASLTLESKKSVLSEGGGASIQVNSDFSGKINALQVLDQATILALKNKNVWIMVKPSGTVSATNQEIKIKNVILNVEPKLDASKNNKSMLVLSFEKSEYDEANVYAFASNSTTVS